MPNLLRVLPVSMALAGLSPLAFAQTGPQLTVGPGLIYTVASRTTINLSSASFNGIVFKSNPATLYVSDAHNERNNTISLGNVYAIDLTTGGVKIVAGAAPDHTNGNIADCTAGAQAVCPGDGGPATSAKLHEPAGLALDSTGNLYIADDRQRVIRRVDAATGVITTIAGTGGSGSGGDGGPARNAAFAFPSGIAFDGSNNLYIADTLNHRIRIITASNGVINTVAGTTAGFAGDNGPATSAQLDRPLGVAVDRAGNVFIADTQNSAIREVTAADGKINTVAGQGGVAGYSGDGGSATSAKLQYPIGIAVDASGSFYIADDNNNVIRKVTGDATHIISTIAGNTNGTAGYSGDNGPALTALLNNPTNMIVDGQNNLYIVDGQFSAVRKITGTAAPLTLPLTGSSAFPLTLSNTGGQTLNISSITFPSNFTAGPNATCPPGSFNLAPGQSCTLPVSFTSGGSTSGTLAFNGNQPGGTTNVTLSASNGLYFVPVPPCRVIDTRLSVPNFGGPAFSAKETRNYAIRNSAGLGSPGLGCAASYIPAAANVQAYSLNVTVVPPGPLTFVTVFPGRTSLPNVSTLNSYDGRTKANAAIVPANTGDSNREISIYASDPTHVVVDINGYYVPEADPAANNNGQTPLAYYPLPPCRAIDTRTNSGSTGSGVPLLANTTTNYTLTGTCGLSANAQAYALNYTALPRTSSLRYITTWPTGGTQPIVSTINATTGAITANAAIVPAPASANGSVSVFTTEDTDLIIDVAGYYAPPSSSANGLALYNLTPCRVYDSRFAGGAPGTGAPLSGDATYNTNIGSSCNATSAAQSYVLNTTVIPNQGKPMRYLTAWAQSSAQPLQSVLNASDGAVSSNLAVVPTVNGSVSTYVSETTGLILDLSAYFAP